MDIWFASWKSVGQFKMYDDIIVTTCLHASQRVQSHGNLFSMGLTIAHILHT